MKKRKVAVFDIDGTIFRSSLLIELMDALIEDGLFPEKVRQLYAEAYANWSDRQGTYEDYINAVVAAYEKYIKGVDHDAYGLAARRVIAGNQERVYRYTRDLVQALKKKGYFLLAISHSPKEIVQHFCEKLGFDKVYGRAHEVDKHNKFTKQTLFLDLISDKAKVLQRVIDKEGLTLEDSIAVGDSEGDITLMKMVQKPICFNPNARLYAQAKRHGWTVVVERKDVIYKM